MAESPVVTVIVSPAEWDSEAAQLSGAAYRHLFRARRLRSGDGLRVVDGEGRARAGTVSEIGPRVARVDLGETIPANEPAVRVELFVAAPRPQRAAWLAEKATELGVSAMRFARTARSPRRYGPATVERLRRVAGAAVEQCGRSRVPEVEIDIGLEDVIERLAGFEARLLLDPAAADDRRSVSKVASAALIVGPEGGWEAAELQSLHDAGCRAMRLGSRVLRVETAALAAAALILCEPRD